MASQKMKMEDYWWKGQVSQVSQSKEQPLLETMSNPAVEALLPKDEPDADMYLSMSSPLLPDLPAQLEPPTKTDNHVLHDQPAEPKPINLKAHCKYFSTGGKCGKKGKCKFLHDNEYREVAILDNQARPSGPVSSPQYDANTLTTTVTPSSLSNDAPTKPALSNQDKRDNRLKKSFREIERLITKEKDPEKQERVASRTLCGWEEDGEKVLSFGAILRNALSREVWEELLKDYPVSKEVGGLEEEMSGAGEGLLESPDHPPLTEEQVDSILNPVEYPTFDITLSPRKQKFDDHYTSINNLFLSIQADITAEKDPKKQRIAIESTLRTWEKYGDLTQPFIVKFGEFLRGTLRPDMWEDIVDGCDILKGGLGGVEGGVNGADDEDGKVTRSETGRRKREAAEDSQQRPIKRQRLSPSSKSKSTSRKLFIQPSFFEPEEPMTLGRESTEEEMEKLTDEQLLNRRSELALGVATADRVLAARAFARAEKWVWSSLLWLNRWAVLFGRTALTFAQHYCEDSEASS